MKIVSTEIKGEGSQLPDTKDSIGYSGELGPWLTIKDHKGTMDILYGALMKIA